MKRIAIIGAGALGCLAAIKIKATLGPKVEVFLYERNARIARKVANSGNGKGNLTNIHVSPLHYNDPAFVQPILTSYNCDYLRTYFTSIGLLTRIDEEGRVYPYNESANSIVDVLRYQIENLGIKVIAEYVDSLQYLDHHFLIETESFDYVIVAIGSIAASLEKKNHLTASLEKLGHPITTLSPSLAPLPTTSPLIAGLNGVRVKAQVTLLIDSNNSKSEEGEVLFKQKAVSGIVIFNLTSFYNRYLQVNPSKSASLIIDMFPQYTTSDLATFIQEQQKRYAWKSLSEILAGLVHKMIGLAVVKAIQLQGQEVNATSLAQELKNFTIPVEPPTDYASCQVISGGFETKFINANSLESQIISNLYLGGEALNIDGDCGGYNLHYAFASGLAIAADIIDKENK